jgi:hypothetical protein
MSGFVAIPRPSWEEIRSMLASTELNVYVTPRPRRCFCPLCAHKDPCSIDSVLKHITAEQLLADENLEITVELMDLMERVDAQDISRANQACGSLWLWCEAQLTAARARREQVQLNQELQAWITPCRSRPTTSLSIVV